MDDQRKLNESLWKAAKSGNVKEVDRLILKGAQINYQKESGFTPLIWPCVSNHTDTVKLLLEKGADPNICDIDGWSPLHWTENIDVADLLIAHGASLTAKGNTALHETCRWGRTDVVIYLVEKGSSLNAVNNENVTPIDILHEPGLREVITREKQRCLALLREKGYNTDPKVSDHDVERIDKEISNAPHGDMKVGRFLLHGAPRVGKSSVKLLIVNEEPKELDSTRFMEDPVRSICMSKCISVDGTRLQEMDEEKMIRMIQREIHEASKSKKKSNRESKTKESSQTTAHDSRVYHPANNPTHVSSAKKHSLQATPKLKLSPFRSKVLHDIATDIESLDPDIPSLFQCHHIYLVDSGGQPQFSNLLPLVFQSQSHHHLVVIRLDEKLSDKPTNCFEIKSIKHVQPGNLMLTNYQLIERVCQLASGSSSHVIIVGTHLDVESKEEPLEKKIELLEPLMKKYENNLVLTKDDKPIFAVNAMAPVGKEREEYAQILQEVILNAPILADEGLEASEEGIPVPLRWIVLELELSRRSKSVGVFQMSEIEEIAQDLSVDDLPKAFAFFNKLAIHYHYPEALPNIVFTSITPISSRLSDIVEASFTRKHGTISAGQKKLQKTGEASSELLKKLSPKLPADNLFPLEDFICLMRYLRVLFDIDSGTFLIPSLLPVEAPPLENNYHEPLLCFWMNADDGEIRILPQSYYHALIVEITRNKEMQLNKCCKHSRSTFHFLFTLPSGDECRVLLVDCVFWLEVLVDGFASHEECQPLLDIIQLSTERVLEQLKLTNLGKLQYGLHCYSPKCTLRYPHPSKCTSRSKCVFACLSEGYHSWKEEDEKRLFWFKGAGPKVVDCIPSTDEAFIELLSLTRDITDWSVLALLLGLSSADFERVQLNNSTAQLQHQAIIRQWLESGKASWSVLINALISPLVNKGAVAIEILKQHPTNINAS